MEALMGDALPLDIKPGWLNVIRRLQSVTHRNNGLAVVEMKVLINKFGEPVQWTEPKLTLLEPKRDPSGLLDLLA